MTLVLVQDPCLIRYSEIYIIEIAIIYFMLLCSFGPMLLLQVLFSKDSLSLLLVTSAENGPNFSTSVV